MTSLQLSLSPLSLPNAWPHLLTLFSCSIHYHHIQFHTHLYICIYIFLLTYLMSNNVIKAKKKRKKGILCYFYSILASNLKVYISHLYFVLVFTFSKCIWNGISLSINSSNNFPKVDCHLFPYPKPPKYTKLIIV